MSHRVLAINNLHLRISLIEAQARFQAAEDGQERA